MASDLSRKPEVLQDDLELYTQQLANYLYECQDSKFSRSLRRSGDENFIHELRKIRGQLKTCHINLIKMQQSLDSGCAWTAPFPQRPVRERYTYAEHAHMLIGGAAYCAFLFEELERRFQE